MRHYIGGKGKPAKETYPINRPMQTERVVTDEQMVQMIFADWPEEQVINFCLNTLGSEARAWWFRRKEHQE